MTHPPQWRQPYATSDSNGNGYGQMRERVAGLEKDTAYLDQRLTETIDRLVDGEQQKGRLAHRVGNLEMINSSHSALVLKIADVPDRVLKLEADIGYIRERLKTALLVILIMAGVMGWLPPEMKSSILKGLLPPGIG